jgi:hypothetical protein
VINTKFPQIGELILKRLVLQASPSLPPPPPPLCLGAHSRALALLPQFRKTYRRNDKRTCLDSAKFIANLVNQQVRAWDVNHTAHPSCALKHTHQLPFACFRPPSPRLASHAIPLLRLRTRSLLSRS